MKSILFFVLLALSLAGCYDSGYQPSYIISQEESELEDLARKMECPR